MKKIFNALTPFSMVASIVFLHICFFFALRLVLLYFVQMDIVDRDAIDNALYIGLKFDARYAVFVSLPLCIALLFPACERALYAVKSKVRLFFCGLQTTIFALFCGFHILDFGIYFYLQKRLDLSILEFAENPKTSAIMVWQSYPVIWISLAFILFIVCYFLFFNCLLKSGVHRPIRKKTPWKESKFFSRHGFSEVIKLFQIRGSNAFSVATFMRVACLIMLFILGYGQISSNFFPLRWSHAYFSADPKVSLLAVHPIQNIYDTRNLYAAVPADLEAAKEAYPRIAKWLDIDIEKQKKDDGVHRLHRFTPAEEREQPINIVMIMMESLATPRTSLDRGMAAKFEGYQEDFVDSTPFMRELAEKSLYYPNFYVNSRTTARGIFSTLTGIPDVSFSGGTSSRNPRLVDQHIIFNEFDGYERFYCIGGNASWANIRGVFQNNVEDLKIIEESDWDAPNVDVWGVSDLNVFKESVKLFNGSKKPFIAFVQSASFHRPYTIPSDNDGYIPIEPSPEALRYYGFESAEEFQSLRFFDHSLRRFFEEASKEEWFENTVFILFGDHGLTNPSTNMTQSYISAALQSWHTPLIIYGPKFVPAYINPALHSQADIFPTAATIAGVPYKSTTFGRTLVKNIGDETFIPVEFKAEEIDGNEIYVFDPKLDEEHRNIVPIARGEGGLTLLYKNYVYHQNVPQNDRSKNFFYDITVDEIKNLETLETEEADMLQEMGADFYHMSKYLLPNNKK